MGLALAAHFNSCGKVEFAQDIPSRMNVAQGAAIILINGDAPYTNSDLVQLNLDSERAEEVYVTNDSTCASGGDWEPLIPTKNWTLPLKNQKAAVYAKFRSINEGFVTPCLSDDILHDDIPPEVVLQQPTMVTNIETPIVMFMAGDSGSGLDRMVCEWPGKAPEACSFATSNGNVPEDRYLIKIHAMDRAGNVSVPVVQDLLVDRTPPTIQFLSTPPTLGADTSVSHAFNVTDDRAGVKSVECAYNDKSKYAACASPQSAQLMDGQNRFYVRAYDFAGNMREAEHVFTIDSSAPTVKITKSPPDFSKDHNGTFEFEGQDDGQPINQFECRLDGGNYASCSTPKTYTNLADGLHTFEVVGVDAIGNRSAPATRSWYVDTVAPVVTFVLTPPSLGKESNVAFKYDITDVGSGVDKSECSLDGGAYAACSMTMINYNDLADGSHTFRVRATDKAGNQGLSDLITFVIDKNPPTINFTRVPEAYTNSPNFDFGFRAEDANGIDRVECKLDSGAFVACDSVMNHVVQNLAEGAHRFTIRATDKAGNKSAEVRHEWTVDLTLPQIAYYQLPPESALEGTVISLGFTASDALSGVKTVVCKLDGAVTSCQSGEIKTLADLAVGSHNFEVIVTDNAGNVATDTRTINITPPVLKTQLVDVKGNSKVDILMIIDNSGSMAQEHQNMAARFSNFLDKIVNLDWQLGFITTDVSSNAPRKDGRLLPLVGLSGEYILTSALPMGTAESVFASTIQMPTNGSGNERGFRAAIRAIDRAFDGSQESQPNAQLFRPEAALAMLVVSDSYDDSNTTPEQVIAKVNQRWGGNKPFVFHSVVIPQSQYTDPNRSQPYPNDPCKDYRESVKHDGREYHRLSQLTGGVQGTACSNDYSSQLADMGKITVELVSSVTLLCMPIDYNRDGVVNQGDVEVIAANGVPITDFTVQGMKLTFSNGLPMGENQIRYYCAQ